MNIIKLSPRPSNHIPKPTRTPGFPYSPVSFNLGFRSKPRKEDFMGRFWGSHESREMELLQNLSKGLIDWSKNHHQSKIGSFSCDEDIFDAASAAKGQPQHLVIMVNGLNGSSADWRFAAKQLVRRFSSKVIVHCSEVNTSRLTFEGVDRMGERLADEVCEVVQQWPGLHKISFVAHSLGGLVARYAVGILYSGRIEPVTQLKSFSVREGQQLEQYDEGRIAGLEPLNFVTFATPHLGSIGNQQVPFLCGLPFLEKTASQTAHFFAGRSGKHLFLTDEDEGKPLLLQMANDSDNIKFMSALRSFRRRVAYANANCDLIVGWRTSSIRRQQELPETNLLMKYERYPHIVHVDQDSNQGITQPFMVGTGEIDLEEEMVKGLNQVPWVRVDVSFRKSSQRYIAHNTIQVKSYWLNSDGADIVEHMIDDFVI